MVDNSSAFRLEPWAELVIPEVNPEALERGAKVYSVPNCTIITALMAVAPLHREAGLRSLSLASYQSLYFVPSSAVPPNVVCTSKTFCPPHAVASGSS